MHLSPTGLIGTLFASLQFVAVFGFDHNTILSIEGALPGRHCSVIVYWPERSIMFI